MPSRPPHGKVLDPFEPYRLRAVCGVVAPGRPPTVGLSPMTRLAEYAEGREPTLNLMLREL